MSATPGGTKKKPRLAMRKSVRPRTHSSLMTFSFNKSVRISMPMILAGSFTPVNLTISSPKVRQPNRIKHCLTIIILNTVSILMGAKVWNLSQTIQYSSSFYLDSAYFLICAKNTCHSIISAYPKAFMMDFCALLPDIRQLNNLLV